MKYKIENGLTERTIDDNGYLYVAKSPILKAGVLEYLGSELLPEDATDNKVDGVEVEPEKIYKVYIPLEEIEKAKDTFKLKPITDGHTWLGTEGEDPKKYQVGTIGENVFVEDGFLYAPLEFTGKDIIRKIQEHAKEELSSSYTNRFAKSDNSDYDFIARDIKGNHLALVDKGRCGSSVRVLNSIKGDEMAQKAKICNEAILKLDGKEINLDKFFEEEAAEKENGADVHEKSLNEDKRDIIRQIMAVAGKDEKLFEGGAEEKEETIAKLAEKLAYKPSEDSEVDNEDIEDEEKEEADVDVDEEKEEDKAKIMNAMSAKIIAAVKADNQRRQSGMVKAYNAARGIVGDFNPFGMDAKAIYVKALNHMGVKLTGNEKEAELDAMLRACSAVRSKVDNGFDYGVSEDCEEKDFNV